MFTPKCYTIINKLYDPKNDIRNIRNKINEWIEQLEDKIHEFNVSCPNKEINPSNEEEDLSLRQLNQIFDTIDKYVNNTHFPNNIDMPFYEEVIEGWTLIKSRNDMEKEYPREYKQVLLEEKREMRERSRMMKEDDYNKW
jgi:uncharacterized protein (UPF0147 family)